MLASLNHVYPMVLVSFLAAAPKCYILSIHDAYAKLEPRHANQKSLTTAFV